MVLARSNECDWVEIRIGHYNSQNATSTVTPKPSFVRFPQAEEQTRSTVEPLTRVLDLPCVSAQGFLPRRDQAQSCFVNEVWQNHCLGWYINTDFILLKRLKSHQKTLSISYNYIHCNALRNMNYQFNWSQNGERWKWKYTVTSEDMTLQFSEFVFSKQTYLFLLVLNKYNNGFMFAFAVLS